MDYRYEQRGRRPIVLVAMAISVLIVGLAARYEAELYVTAGPGLAGVMALIIYLRNSHSGLVLADGTLTLFKDHWRKQIATAEIRQARFQPCSGGQPSLWLDLVEGPPFRVPGYCFGPSAPLAAALRECGIATA